MVIVVLGCRVRATRGFTPGAAGHLAGAAGRRVAAAARAFREEDARGHNPVVIASGGKKWEGVVEADAMAEALTELGVPASRVLRERCSFSTRENARYVAALVARRGEDEAVVVTCAWHLPRAAALFAKEGMRVRGVGAEDPTAGRFVRALRWGRERLAAWKDGVA
jgi:uncharacterized SAM-binding protein YcdF (DUF218 family)